jgi:FkbM family methyltransferase
MFYQVKSVATESFIMRIVSRALFWKIARLGRSIGGLRPRRFANLLAGYGFGKTRPQESEYRWIRDSWGNELFLHPFFVIDRAIIANGDYEPDLKKWINNNISKGSVCFDIGANIGVVSTQIARKVGADGRVYCFEPVPRINNLLRNNLQRNGFLSQAIIVAKALSDHVGEATFHVASEFAPNQGMGSLVTGNSGELKVELDTLDNFCDNEGVKRIDFIKLDIQGAEPLFLKGAMKSISRFKPIVAFEISPEDLANCGHSMADLTCNFLQLGYTIRRLNSNGSLGKTYKKEDLQTPFYASNVLAIPTSRSTQMAPN